MSAHVERVRQLVSQATQALLGDTIQLSDADWRAPSALDGWSRGHVATHLARNAEGMAHVIRGQLTGQPATMYDSPQARESGIADGAGRPGLELQEDLDTSAGQLDAAFDDVVDWQPAVELHPGVVCDHLASLPTARLAEVVLHHLDLRTDFTLDALSPETAHLLMNYAARRMADRDGFPALTLKPTDGAPLDCGNQYEVSATSAQLLGWLTGRTDASAIGGAHGITLPPF